MRKSMKAAALLSCAAMTLTSAGAAFAEEASVYPIYEEPKEFTMFRMAMPNVEDFATNDFTLYMEELTNVKFKMETGSREDWSDKLNMAFNTESYPDVIMYVSPDEAKWGVDEGILIQLDDLIYENMPNYVEKMGEYIDSTRQTDGHIYSIAGLNECYHCQFAGKMWVNTKYLEEMGVEMPTTTQEFYDVCKKFVEMYPDKIAIAGATSGWYVDFADWLMNSFILTPRNSYKTVVSFEDGTITCVATQDEYKEGLKYIKSLYEIGAIYDGNFTQDAEQVRTIMNQEDVPVLFVPYGTISDGIDAESNNEVYRQYQVISPLEGPEGVRLAPYYKYSGVEEGSFSITDKCEDPAAMLRWVDYFFSDKGDISAQFGADEGTDWVWQPEDGSVGLNGEPAMYAIAEGAQYSSETQNHDWQDVSIRYAPAEYRLGQATDADIDVGTGAGLEKLLFDASKEKMEPFAQTPENSKYDVHPSIKLTADETTEIQTIGVEVKNYITENRAAFITGAKDIDADWDAYLQGLNDCGLEKLLEIYQTAYDRQMGVTEE